MKIDNFAILLNTCDSYSDLWPIFFQQLKKNFKIDDIPIYINTESKTYFDSELNIQMFQKEKINMAWSTRLKESIKEIKEEYILSIPEECILESETNHKDIHQALEILINDISASSICLVKIPGSKKASSKIGKFVVREYNYRNLIVQQASIWRKSRYLAYIKDGENPWEFEVLSSARGLRFNDEFYCIDDNENEVLDYNYGHLVTRGYWLKEELTRLESKLNIIFDKQKRAVKSREEINREYSRYSMFFWKLRYKKYKILIFKKFFGGSHDTVG